MARDELYEYDQRLTERLVASEFALLNTLANIAGLFIGAASLLATLSPQTPRGYFLAIIVLSAVVLICVVYDFRLYRRSYQGIAFTPKAIWGDPAVAEAYSSKLATQKIQTRASRRWKRYRERLAYACIIAAVLLFVVVVCRY